jgi:hypothetical protein
VFRYTVPQNQSHYAVTYRSRFSDKGDAGPSTAYHGEVAIDPATGAILRLSVQAEPPLEAPIFCGDMMVGYGPVEIGGKTYTCPLRRVSIWLGGMELYGLANRLGSLFLFELP